MNKPTNDPPSNVVSIREQNIEKNKAAVKEAADEVIRNFEIILRLTGMRNATVMRISNETDLITHTITCTEMEPSHD